MATHLPSANPNSWSRLGRVLTHTLYTPKTAPFAPATTKETRLTTIPLHEHHKLVELAADHMIALGYTRVRASHLDRFTACDQIGSYIPDVTAFSGSAFVVAEAESRDGLALAHTEAQWKTFHNQANNAGGFFVAVVNKSDVLAANALLKQVCGSAANVDVWTF